MFFISPATARILDTQPNSKDLGEILNFLGQKTDIQFLIYLKKPIEIDFKEFSFHNYSINSFLKFLSERHNLIFFIENDRIIIKELDFTLGSYNLSYLNFYNDDQYRVSHRSILDDKVQDEKKLRGNRSLEKRIRNFLENNSKSYDFWEEIEENIKVLSKNNYAIDKYTGIINVIGDSQIHSNVKTYLENISKKIHSQIFIECKVLEITLDINHNIDLQPILHHAMKNYADMEISSCVDSIFASCREKYSFISMQQSSQINILTLNQVFARTSSIKEHYFLRRSFDTRSMDLRNWSSRYYRKKALDSGDSNSGFIASENYESRKHGFILDILPSIIDSENILLKISSSLSAPIGRKNENPALMSIQTRNFDTILKTKNGQNIVLGGLYLEQEYEENERPPFLLRIFQKKKSQRIKSYFVLVIKATIM